MRTMTKWLVCLMVIGMLVGVSHEEGGGRLEPGVVDPCQRPGGPHPGCQNPGPRQQANQYTRGCSQTTRCRGGPGTTHHHHHS